MKSGPYALLLLASIMLTGCNEFTLDGIAEELGDTISVDAIQIDGEDSFYGLDNQGKIVASIEVEDGDFVTPINNDTLYFEQNDELAPRTAVVNITYNDSSKSTVRYCQKVATRSVEGRQFLRHHGVGYSYNGVSGKSCNLRDFRCQILNRAMLEKIGEKVGYNFLLAESLSELKYTHSSYSSVTDYIQNSNIQASGSAKIVVFEGDASATCSLFEEGQKSSYILKNEAWINRAEYSVDEDAICEYAKKYPALLTSSFRHAIANLKTNVDIDNFLDKYGTHVVVYSKLGARLTLEVQVETHKFNTREEVNLLANASIATLFKYQSETASQSKNYEILRDATCRLTILGGDLNYMDKAVDLNRFTNDEFSESMVSNWVKSVKHNENDLANSNVEMTDMEVVPIWYFIPNEDVAKLVEARVTGNVSYIAETVGNKNFINTSFNLLSGSVKCKIGGVSQTFSNPDVIEVIVANRHVATICHEYVPDLTGTYYNTNEKVWVAYPIYEGRVQLENGLCIYKNSVFDVAWDGSKFEVSERTETPSGGTVYMNMGKLSTVAADNLTYQTAHYILGAERPGGVSTEGALSGEMVKIYKYFGHFYLQNTTRYYNLPGWSWMTAVPEAELKNYPSYFSVKNTTTSSKTNGYPYRMWRDADYTYIYNPNEVSYE